MKSVLVPLALTALAIASSPALAQTSGPFSVGLGLGPDNARVDCLPEFACDHTDKFFKLFGNYRLGDAVELQATYFHAGHFQGGDIAPLGTHFGGTYSIEGISLTAGYRWWLTSQWSVVARGGLASVRATFAYSDPDYGADKGKTTVQPYGSAGIAYSLTPQLKVGLDYDLTRLKAHDHNGSLQMFGVTAQYAF